jgi:hypothetical protein
VPAPFVDTARDVCRRLIGSPREDEGRDVQVGERAVAPSAGNETFSVEITGLALDERARSSTVDRS